MNYHILNFRQELADRRLEKATAVFGKKITLRIVAFAMFLLGATRSSIAEFLDIPPGTIRSLIRALDQRGLSAFEDQRSRTSCFKTPLPSEITPYIEESESSLNIMLGVGNRCIRLPKNNIHQKRVVLLTLLESGLITQYQVAQNLGLSKNRIGKLVKSLQQKDVSGVMDQRRGQQKDYLFTPEIKAELIQQFIIDIVTKGKTSGELLSKEVQERCNIKLAPRSILYHISQLGLSGIKTSLPAYLNRVKKTL